MNLAKAEQLCISAIRNIVTSFNYEACSSRVVVRRLDAHLRKCPARAQKRAITTSTRHLNTSLAQHHNAQEVPEPYIAEPDALQALRQPYIRPKQQLPQTCPGCGALTQEVEFDQAGYYSRSRRAVKQYLKKSKLKSVLTKQQEAPSAEKEAILEEEEEADEKEPAQSQTSSPIEATATVPLCDRCHDLVHNFRGQSIAHPSIQNIAESIAESPFRRNHIYHVLDAADFPMSLVPDIFTQLELAKPRSRNRRSQHDFSTKPTISFIITRSDLLGSTKEMVDSMMTYFQSVLRQALGRAGKDMRLGNIHLVSAKRGWWTKEIKEDIWKRGGGNWMVGKVNVGKSNLFEVLFPKGSGERAPVYEDLKQQQKKQESADIQTSTFEAEGLLEEDSLLPPAQPEVSFPILPVVSSLPGTTASPIRLPFGGHRGELIDMPGVDRGNLEHHVKEDRRLDLVMTHRHNVEQHNIKPGQSLVLGGGLIRITPQLSHSDPSTIVLAYPFVPLQAHVTSTEKAIAQQLQQRKAGIEDILAENVGAHMASAGILDLETDVTKRQAGPLLRSGVPLARLPFRVYATDILIEGMGWVELVCQVRRRSSTQPASTNVAREQNGTSTQDPPDTKSIPDSNAGFSPFAIQPQLEVGKKFEFPKIEVFSPNGKHISQRPSLEAWMRWNQGRNQHEVQKLKRPRRSMGSH